MKTIFKRLTYQFSKFQNTAALLLFLCVLTSKHQILVVRESSFTKQCTICFITNAGYFQAGKNIDNWVKFE